MSAPRSFRTIPAPEMMDAVVAKIQSRCQRCPACETDWLWVGNHKDEIWHATIETKGIRYNVRRTVHAWHSKAPLAQGNALTTRCECQNCLNPALIAVETKGDVVRRQTAQGLLHHAQHRAAIDRARRQSGQNKLDMAKAREIRASEESLEALAKQYGVSSEAIRRVRANQNWRETTPFTGLGAR